MAPASGIVNTGVCWRQDLNLHALRHWNLNPACLPFHHSSAKGMVARRDLGERPKAVDFWVGQEMFGESST